MVHISCSAAIYLPHNSPLDMIGFTMSHDLLYWERLEGIPPALPADRLLSLRIATQNTTIERMMSYVKRLQLPKQAGRYRQLNSLSHYCVSTRFVPPVQQRPPLCRVLSSAL